MQLEAGFVVESHYSQWQKKKVRTILVNARAKTQQQRSISSALSLARPYDRIELSGGNYPEAITLNFPVELVASEGEDPQIISRNSGITVTANTEVLIENLTVVSRSTSGRLDAALTLMAGTALVKGCTLSSVLIRGMAQPTLENCIVTSSASGYGILVQDTGGGTIKGCTVRGHRVACVEVDTRGELLVTACTLANEAANVVVISAANSSVPMLDSSFSSTVSGGAGGGGKGLLRCSGVTFSHCLLYVDVPNGTTSMDAPRGELPALANAAGCPTCITICSGAAPVCEANELTEGDIGILLDGAGPAQVRRNVVCCQRRCGFLALVEESFDFLEDYESLCITSDNELKRCYIGIDVQCRGNHKDVFAVSSEATLSAGVPSGRRAFSWLPRIGTAPSPREDETETAGLVQTLVHGDHASAVALKRFLSALISLTLQVHQTCLKPTLAVTASSSILHPGLTNGSPVADVLLKMMDVKLPSNNSGQGGRADQTARATAEKAKVAMLELRGNRGVDIVQTKFSSCNLCAIRFGKQSYGLVEDCVFEDCGTHAILIDAAAHPLVTGCRFLHSRKASIVVNNFAHPFILGNEIAMGQTHGIEIANMSRGIYAGNIITGNRGCGVHVSEQSHPLLCGNVISQNRNGGVYVTDAGQTVVLANHLLGNPTANLVCTGGSNAFVVFNTVQASTDVGLAFTNCSHGTVICNEVSTNKDGMVVELDADPCVCNNTIHDNLRSGVTVQNNALGSFTCNRLSGNRGPNILVTEGANPHFRDNDITSSANGGVVVTSEGLGYFEKNRFTDNAVGNVLVVGQHSEPVFEHNTITASTSGCGVVCVNGAGGRFTHNSIHDNRQAGVYVIGLANPVFVNNTIAREAVGVLLSDGGKGHFRKNTIEKCFGAGVISQREAEPLFEDNTVEANGMSGLLVTPDGLGKFIGNCFRDNDVGVQLGSSLKTSALDLHSAYLGTELDSDSTCSSFQLTSTASSNVGFSVENALYTGLSTAAAAGGGLRRSLRGSRVSSAAVGDQRASISVFSPNATRSVLQDVTSITERRRVSTARSSACQIYRNTIVDNKNSGVLLECNCNGVMEENEVSGNGDYGVRGNIQYATQRAQAIVEELYHISGVGPIVSTVPHLIHGLNSGPIVAGGGAGFVMEAKLRKNRISKHKVANVAFDAFTDKTGVARLIENEIHTAPVGVLVTNASVLPSAEQNTIFKCLDGVYMDHGASGEFTGNRVRDCYLCGVYVASQADPLFVRDNLIESCGLAGVMVDASGRGTFSQGTMRACGLAGVLVFAGPTTPFHVSYEEITEAGIATATPTFKENTIAENESHGVLVLSVISGCPLRTPRAEVKAFQAAGHVHFPAVPPPTSSNGGGGGRLAGIARGERLCAFFVKNTIDKNRLFGVFHDRFEHWDLNTIFDAAMLPLSNSSFVPPSPASAPAQGKAPVRVPAQLCHNSLSLISPRRQQRPTLSTSPVSGGIKNAYGGYEILLGTSQIGTGDEHHRQRELKQVTFKENTICHSCVGFAAGYGCHPFLLRNKIVDNVFIGLLLRFGSAVMVQDCEVARNGLAGVHAASGAKGFLSKCTINENNGLCRPQGNPHTTRCIEDVMADVATAHHTEQLATYCDLTLEALAPQEVKATHKAAEQVVELANVHAYTLTEGVRVLWEVACASSAAPSIASGSAPSALSSGVANSPSMRSIRSPVANQSTTKVLAGLGVEDYIRVCVADGGLGVWLEEGSRVTLSENVIESNQHAGVYFAAGVTKQHRILHKYFSISGDGMGAFDASSMSSSAECHSSSNPCGVAAVLVMEKGVLRQLPSSDQRFSDERGCAVQRMFALPLERPVLATQFPAALFTSHALCASAVVAAAAATQLLTTQASFSSLANNLSSSATNASFGSEGSVTESWRSAPAAPVVANNGMYADRPSQWTDYEEKSQRIDSIHCVRLIENCISRNGEYGVVLELLQVMRAVEQRKSSTHYNNNSSSSSNGNNNTSPTPTSQSAITPADTAVMSEGDTLVGKLDFHVALKSNTLSGNKRCGLFCQHLVEIHAEAVLDSRGMLCDLIDKEYEAVRADLVLGRPVPQVSKTEPLPPRSGRASTAFPPFSLMSIRSKTHRALIIGNDFASNDGVQSEVTARYVVTTKDGVKTLLQFDNKAELSTSSFSSHVLERIPVVAALLSRPPVSLCLWEKNTFHDCKRGVLVCGFVGAASLRLQRNHFSRVKEEAVLVEGHLSACTLGSENVFQACGVGVRVCTSGSANRTTSTLASELRTRIFGNTFVASLQSSLLVDSCLGQSVLLFGNAFTQHGVGTTAVFLTSETESGALVHANTFSNSYTPVVITGGTRGEGSFARPMDSVITGTNATGDDNNSTGVGQHLFTENYFLCNFIGAIVCAGATPRLVRNVFENNTHAGLELIGLSTRPVIENCVFRKHCRSIATTTTTTATSASTSSSRTKGANNPHAFPADGKVTLFSGTFSVTLVPGNVRVLSPNSQVCLPAGLLLGPYAECLTTGCYFVDNDIGLDAARYPLPPSLELSCSVACFAGCLFYANRIAGVLVRHPDGVQSPSNALPKSLLAKASAVRLSDNGSLSVTAGIATEDPRTPETTIVSDSFFMANCASEELCSDVLCTRNGFAVFRSNTFFGTVHCKTGALSLFTANTFVAGVGSGKGGDAANASDFDVAGEGDALGGGELPATANAALPAVILHEGANARVEENTVAFRCRGLLACPEASGQVKRNTFVGCKVAVTVAPFSHTVVAENRIFASDDCGLLVFGGLVTGNVIFDAPTGLVLQPPAQYSRYNAIPSHKRNTRETALCTSNTISLCSGDGILVSCSAKVERNTVSRCQVGISIVCPATMESVATATGVKGLAAAPPQVQSNTIFDCTNGVVFEDKCVGNVCKNEIFDNAMVGVLILSTATGTLQSNTISCPKESGAVDTPPDSCVKVFGNTIRNLFSPAYNRMTRAERSKDQDAKCAAAEKDVARSKNIVHDTVDIAERKLAKLQHLSTGMINRIASAVDAKGTTVLSSSTTKNSIGDGLTARMLLRRSLVCVSDGSPLFPDETAGENDQEDILSSSDNTSTTASKSRRANAKSPSSLTNSQNRFKSGPAVEMEKQQGNRRTSAGTRRTSTTAVLARKQAAAEVNRTTGKRGSTAGSTRSASAALRANSPTKSSNKNTDAGSAASTEPKSVFIHVFVRPSMASAHTSGLALGEAVARVLASPPMSRMNLNTTITTSTSQLSAALHPARRTSGGGDNSSPATIASAMPIEPFIAIAVIDEDTSALAQSTVEEALWLLVNATHSGTPAGSATKRVRRAAQEHFLYLVHPESVKVTAAEALPSVASVDSFSTGNHQQADDSATSPRRVPLKDFAVCANDVFAFRDGVEDALDSLKEAMVRNINNSATAAMSHRQSLATVDFPHETSQLEGYKELAASGDAENKSGGQDMVSFLAQQEDEDLDDSSKLSLWRQGRSNASFLTHSGPMLSREKIGDLFSKLTPEALGYASPDSTNKKKKRRKSSATSSASSKLKASLSVPSRDIPSPAHRSSSASVARKRRSVASPGPKGLPPIPISKCSPSDTKTTTTTSPSKRAALPHAKSMRYPSSLCK